MTDPHSLRERRITRRAASAGVVVWAVATVIAFAVFTSAGGGGRAALLSVTMGLVVGALVTTTWLLLSVLLDLFAGIQPGRRRLWWTVGSFAFSFVSPALVLGAAGGG